MDVDALADAMAAARDERSAPSLIQLRTVIAWPAPTLQNTGKSHGSALGAAEVAATKRPWAWTRTSRSPSMTRSWPTPVRWASAAPSCAPTGRSATSSGGRPTPMRPPCWTGSSARRLPDGWRDALPTWEPGTSIATRVASESVINALAGVLPELWGGSADLGGSNGTTIKGGGSFLPAGSPLPDADPYGRVIHFGVREHAMGAVLNGIALHGLTRAFGGTFLVFSDYMRAPVRLAGLMSLPSLFIWTHDSVGVGEDGPTHQPIEHLWALRAIPELAVVRPADANETAGGLGSGPAEPRPRRADPHPPERAHPRPLRGRAGLRGQPWGYVIAEADGGEPQLLLLATGSEVSVALGARDAAAGRGGAHPRGVDALPGVVRGPAGRVPGAGAAPRGPGPGQRRGRQRPGLVEVRRHRRSLRVRRALRGLGGRRRSCSRSWASRRTTWRRSPARSWTA